MLLCVFDFDPCLFMHCVVGQWRQVSPNVSSLVRPETSGEAVKITAVAGHCFQSQNGTQSMGERKKGPIIPDKHGFRL